MQSGKKIIVAANNSKNEILVIDLATQQTIQTLPVTFKPHELRISPDKKFVLVSNHGDVEYSGTLKFVNTFTDHFPGHHLSVFEIQGKKLVSYADIDLGKNSRPHGIKCLSNTEALVTAQGIKALLRVDYVKKKVLMKIDLPYDGAHMLTTDSKKEFAYVGCFSGYVIKIDLRTDTVVAAEHLCNTAEDVALSADDKYLFATNGDDGSVMILDPLTLKRVVKDDIKTGLHPARVVSFNHGKSIAVINSGAGTITTIDVATLKADLVHTNTTSICDDGFYAKFLPVPITLCMLDEEKGIGYITNSKAGSISIVDLLKHEIVKTFAAGESPDGSDMFVVDEDEKETELKTEVDELTETSPLLGKKFA